MTEAIVLRFDHAYVPLADPERAFVHLTEKLQLPVAWPFSDHGAFASGGVSLGNLNLEVLRASENFVYGSLLTPARIRGIAVEPVSADDAFLAELDRRGLAHSPPMPFTPPGANNPTWTNIGIGVLAGTTSGVFACKYHFDTGAPRAAARAELDSKDGGPLGLVGAAELVLGAPDADDAIDRWTRLLDPLTPDEYGHWTFPDGGPDLRVVPAPEDGCERLVLALRDDGTDLSELSDALGGLELRAFAA
jgi:hypothetical protein